MILKENMNVKRTDEECIEMFEEKMQLKRFKTRNDQFDYLVNQGLKPKHYFLDVGCGWLRGGLLFMEYLRKGHYFGIDSNQKSLDAGYGGILKYKLSDKDPTFIIADDFRVEDFGIKFDYALAQSLFTHLAPWDVKLCIDNVMTCMKNGGKFYITFFEFMKSFLGVGDYRDGKHMFQEAFYPYKWFIENIPKGCKVEYLGNGIPPFKQKTLVITK